MTEPRTRAPHRLLALLLAVLVVACSGADDWQRKDAWRECEKAIAEWPDEFSRLTPQTRSVVEAFAGNGGR